jgi:NAD(P)H-dependent FMN reductase
MTHLVALSGSLRRESFNTALANAFVEVAPSGVSVEVFTPAGIPLYDADLEAAEGIPDAVATLKERIRAADGLILVTPEYNQGVPGVLKNAVDWLSRPPADIKHVFGDRALALCGASAGRGGSRAAQYAWLPTLRALGVRLWNGGQLYAPTAGQLVGADGRLSDPDMRERAQGFVQGFADFAAGA